MEIHFQYLKNNLDSSLITNFDNYLLYSCSIGVWKIVAVKSITYYFGLSECINFHLSNNLVAVKPLIS